MTESKLNFARISSREWRLDGSVEKDERAELLRGITFTQIVGRITEEAMLISHARERACSKPQFFRAVVTLAMNASTVALFHNSPSGYRAQYYCSMKNGERANQYALKRLIPRIQQMLLGNEKRTCPWWWVEKSLLDPEAKLWIHQGRWFRYATRDDRKLFVARWVHQQASRDRRRRRKAIWATLTPSNETRIDIKGGFLTLDGTRLGRLKPTRAKDIHELGFT